MTLSTQDIAKLVHRYAEDDWKIGNQLREQRGGLSEAEVATLLWETHRSGAADLGRTGANVWRLMTVSGARFSGEDVLSLLRSIHEAWPEGFLKTSWGGRYCWSTSELPGLCYGLAELVQLTLEMPAARRELLAGWSRLPDPERGAVGYLLVQAGVVELAALPEGLIDVAAARVLRNDYLPSWAEKAPWPEASWRAAQVRASQQLGLEINGGRTFARVCAWMVAEEAVSAAARVSLGADPQHAKEAWVALASRCASQRAPLRGRLLELGAAGSMTLEAARSAELLAMGWLELQRQASEPLEAALEPFYRRWIGVFEMRWSGGHYINYCKEEIALLRGVIPAEMLEAMVLAAPGFPWHLGPAAVTWEVVQRAAAAQAGHSGYWTDAQKEALGLFGVDGAPLLSRLMTEDKPKHEESTLRALAAIGGAAVVPGLIRGLFSSAKGSRGLAQSGLVQNEARAAVLAALPEALEAKRKEVREMAASALAVMPVSAEVYKLAQEALKTEKIKAVREQLERVQAPVVEAAASSGAGSALLEGLRASAGGRWREWASTPDAVVLGLVQVIAEVAQEQGRLPYYGGLSDALCEALGTLALSVETMRAVLGLTDHDSSHMGMFFLRHLHEAPGVDLAPWLAELAFSRRLEGRARQAGKGLEQTQVLGWLIDYAPSYREGALVLGLEQGERRFRESCALKLRSLESAQLGEVLGRLVVSEASAETRVLAVELLAERGEVEQVGALAQAAAIPGTNKKERAVQAAAVEALRRLKNLSLDVHGFPEDKAGEAALDAALSELGARLSLEGKAGSLLVGTTLRWRASGAALSEGALRWVIGCVQRETLEVESAPLKAVRARLNDADCAALCDALQGIAPSVERGWGLYAVGTLGGARHVEALGPELEKLASSQSTAWGSDGVEALVRQGSDAVVRWLDHWRRKSKRSALLGRAESGLRRLAASRGVSVEELVDAAMSDLGFDARGRQAVDYGGRTLEFVLAAGGEVVVEDGSGKQVKAPPAGLATDDPAKVAAAKARFKELKKEIKRLLSAQEGRLEAALTAGRSWPVVVWRARFVDHAVMRLMSARLLFEHQGEDGAGRLFAVGAAGALTTLEGGAFALPEAGVVRLLHPAEVSSSARALMERWLAGLGERQPFEQVEREVFTTAELDLEAPGAMVKLRATTDARMFKAMERGGYERGPREDAGLINSFHRTLGVWGVMIVVNGVFPDSYNDVDVRAEVTSVVLSRDGERVAWSKAPRRLYSDVVRSLVQGLGLS